MPAFFVFECTKHCDDGHRNQTPHNDRHGIFEGSSVCGLAAALLSTAGFVSTAGGIGWLSVTLWERRSRPLKIPRTIISRSLISR